MGYFIWLLVALAFVKVWSDVLRAREAALRVCADACVRADAQLLDQTVRLARVGLARNARGQLRWRRHYRFEFSTSGADRLSGGVVMLGTELESLEMQQPDGSRVWTYGKPS